MKVIHDESVPVGTIICNPKDDIGVPVWLEIHKSGKRARIVFPDGDVHVFTHTKFEEKTIDY